MQTIDEPSERPPDKQLAAVHRSTHRETFLEPKSSSARRESPGLVVASRVSSSVSAARTPSFERANGLVNRPSTRTTIVPKDVSGLEMLDDDSGFDGMSIVEFDLHQDPEILDLRSTGPSSSLYVPRASPLWSLLAEIITGHLELRTIYTHIEEGTRVVENAKAQKLTILNGRTAMGVVMPVLINGGTGSSVTITNPWYLCNRVTKRHRQMLARASIQEACLKLCEPKYTENLLLQAVTLAKLEDGGAEVYQTKQLLCNLVTLLVSDLIPYNMKMVLCSQKVPYTADPEAIVESQEMHQTLTSLMEGSARQTETTRALRAQAKEVYQRMQPLHDALNMRSEAIQRSIFLVSIPQGSYKVSKQLVPPRGWSIELVITRLQALVCEVFSNGYRPTEIVTAVKLGAPVFADSFVRRIPEIFRRDDPSDNEATRWVVLAN